MMDSLSALRSRHLKYIVWLSSLIFLVACGGEETSSTAVITTTPTATPISTPTLNPDVISFVHLGTPRPTLTPSPTFTPSATPVPAERLILGERALAYQDLELAITHFRGALRQKETLTSAERETALYSLARAYQAANQTSSAVETFNELLAYTAVDDDVTGRTNSFLDDYQAASYFHLAETSAANGEYLTAIAGYEAYLAAQPKMGAYVYPLMATSYFYLGERDRAITSYETALNYPAHYLIYMDIRRALADFYRADGNYDRAIHHYQAMYDMARTQNTKGELAYLMGQTYAQAGNFTAAQTKYFLSFNEHPESYQSYLSLLALLDAGLVVDEYQRGLVDYHAGVYNRAVEAFLRYEEANPQTRSDTYWYLAWSYEGMGELTTALAFLDELHAREGIAPDIAARALIEKAMMLARAGQRDGAIVTYKTFVQLYPQHERAPFAAWWSAQLTEWAARRGESVQLYLEFADFYPDHEDAPEALFRAGWVLKATGDRTQVYEIWQNLITTYPQSEYAHAALIWLSRELDLADTAVYTAAQTIVPQENYYTLRVLTLLADERPFTSTPHVNLIMSSRDQLEAEVWLRSWLDIPSNIEISELSAKLATDSRLLVGTQLWRLGLQQEAYQELESLRRDYQDDVLATYQLALYYRDLGLYNVSIFAGRSLLRQTNSTVFEAPRFLGSFVFPTYYADMAVPLAQENGFDPLLMFALIRQESLFTSFATSSAAARGLTQIIPGTGNDIARWLNWPDYQETDLYKPYVNLTFGAYYLGRQLDYFDNDIYVALSAYNGGPGNAIRWLNSAGHDPDLYVETVNFPETRLYIENIFIWYEAYQHLYGY